MERTCPSVKDKRGCILVEGHSGNHRTYSGTLQWHNENDPGAQSQSIKSDRISESTIARIAGNLLSGYGPSFGQADGTPDSFTEARDQRAIKWAVKTARMIAAEVKRTQEI